MLMLFYPFRSEETNLMESGSYILKLNKGDVIVTTNRNKGMCEPNGDLVDLVLQIYCNDIKHNQDAFALQENEKVNDQINKMSNSDEDDINENNNHEFNTYTQSNRQLLTDEEINGHIRSLNKKQREIFDIVLDCGKFVSNSKCNHPIPLNPIRMFLAGVGNRCRKIPFVICHYLSKVLVYKGEELEKPRVIKIAPTGIASINIERTSIHTALNIPINHFIVMSNMAYAHHLETSFSMCNW